ncbi:hypothetical protein MHYP_G00305430 [Metynnis hypsauchen]
MHCSRPKTEFCTGFEGQDIVDMASTGDENPLRFMVDSRGNKMIQTMIYLLVSMALFGIVVEACFIYHLYTTKHSSEVLHDKDFPQTDARNDTDTFSFCIMEASTVPPQTSLPSLKKPIKPLAHLTASTVPPQTRLPSLKKHIKPLAHLTGSSEQPSADGVMPWRAEPELHELQYKENKLVVEKEGYYYIYSKLCFDADDATFYHMMMKTMTRYTGTSPIELLRNRYHGDHTKPPQNVGSLQNSYLGGMFHFHKGEAVYVLVKSGRVCPQISAYNYFGMFMV